MYRGRPGGTSRVSSFEGKYQLSKICTDTSLQCKLPGSSRAQAVFPYRFFRKAHSSCTVADPEVRPVLARLKENIS